MVAYHKQWHPHFSWDCNHFIYVNDRIGIRNYSYILFAISVSSNTSTADFIELIKAHLLIQKSCYLQEFSAQKQHPLVADSNNVLLLVNINILS